MDHPDTTNIEAMQWGQPSRVIVDAWFQAHPDLRFLDTYLEWLYGDQ